MYFSSASIRRVGFISTRGTVRPVARPRTSGLSYLVAFTAACALVGAIARTELAPVTVTGRVVLDLQSPATLARGESYWHGMPVEYRARIAAVHDAWALGTALASGHGPAFERYALGIFAYLNAAGRARFEAAYLAS